MEKDDVAKGDELWRSGFILSDQGRNRLEADISDILSFL